MTSALRKLCGTPKTTALDDFMLAKIAAGPIASQTPQSLGIMRRAGQNITNALGAVNHRIGTNVGIAWPKWDEYRHQDGMFWHPSKSMEDNLRGYAETTGEMVGGVIGGTTGFIGGGAMGGPAAPVTAIGGAVGGGYLGGKSGKGFGRNVFNWAWHSNGTQGGVDSLGRNTGYGNNNGLHGNDYMPYWTDLGYTIPVAGGALRVPLNNGLKPMTTHLLNLIGRRGAYTPVYEALPWWQRYAHGPNAQLHPYVNTAKPSPIVDNANGVTWITGRELNTRTGQFSGTNVVDGVPTNQRNLRHMFVPENNLENSLYRSGMGTEDFLMSHGASRQIARYILKNRGERGTYFGKNYGYQYPNSHVMVPPDARLGWQRINQDVFMDSRFMSDAQSSRHSLTGAQTINGRRMPIHKGDGDAPPYSGFTVEGLTALLKRHPNDPVIRLMYDRVTRAWANSPYAKTSLPEITISTRKVPTQGYTKINTTRLPNNNFCRPVDDAYYPWKMVDETPALGPINIMRNGIGTPYSVLGEKAIRQFQGHPTK